MKLVAIAVALAFTISACGKKTPPPPTVAPPATDTPADAAAKAEDAAAKQEDAAAPAADAAAKTEDAAAPAPDVGGAADKGDAAAVAADGALVVAAMIPVTSKSPEAVATFEEGRDLAFNLRTAEANIRFEKALALDPDFLLAQAYRGYTMPGGDGLAMLEKAVAAAGSLPEAERLHMHAMLASKKGDDAHATELDKKVAELAAGDWRAHMRVGMRSYLEDDLVGAVAALTKAAELNPQVGVMHNMIGYANLQQGKKDEAIAAFKKYAELAPNEPNPHDSLAEALLAAKKYPEAEAAFMKAAETKDFTIAWQGVATARALQGNWKGAHEALEKGIELGPRPFDKNELRHQLAWLTIAEGEMDAGLAALTKLAEGAAKENDGTWATYAMFDKAFLLLEAGKLDEAQAATNAAWEVADKLQTGGGKDESKRVALWLQAVIAARGGKAEDAAKHLAALDEASKKVTNALGLSLTTFAHGQVLLVTDAKAAADKLMTCATDDYVCTWYESMAHEKAGDADAAAKAKAEVLDTPHRRMDYLWVMAQIAKK